MERSRQVLSMYLSCYAILLILAIVLVEGDATSTAEYAVVVSRIQMPVCLVANGIAVLFLVVF